MADLEAQAAEPGFWLDQEKARRIIDETNALAALIQPYDRIRQALEDAATFLEIAGEEPAAAARAEALTEADRQLAAAAAAADQLETRLLLNGPFDANSAYLSLNAGAGGTESCDWAEMLLRMYNRYAEGQGLAVTVLDIQPGDEAGIKSAELKIEGAFAYGRLKAERGVHRLVRISPFDANKRRHTSFAAVDVIAEVDDTVEVEIREEDLRVDTYRSSGAGGQHVNKTDSAIRLTHLPTGVVVQCQAERSQHKNRSAAMRMLRAKLYEREVDQRRQEMERFYGQKGEIAWGSQIRSYVMQPYTLVKDHRTGAETGNVQAVLDGAIDPFIDSYLKHSRRQENTPG